MMLSESARMSSSGEARFRIQSSNSQPRSIKVIALDELSEEVLRRLAERSWNRATFLSASTEELLTDLAGSPRTMNEEIDEADLVIMITTAGGIARAVTSIGSACSLSRVNAAAFISGAASASDAAISKTLAQLRPWSLMVVIAGADDYIEDMLVALRA
jgi:hypothetical protein